MSHRELDDIVSMHHRIDELDILISKALAATTADKVVEVHLVAGIAQLRSERRRLALVLSVIEDLGT